MIAQAPSVHYIHEPFNISGPPCSCGVRFDRWFTYVSEENDASYHDHIKHTLGSPLNRFQLLNLISELKMTRRLRALGRYANSLIAARPLVKDPIALCSAEWLATNFDMDVIVLIRHPAAFVSSYKRIGWAHPFSHFLHQPTLIQDHLFPYRAEISEFVYDEHDIIDQASLLWKLLNHIIREYQQAHTDWYFVHYEDIAQEPLSSFQAIYDQLDLQFTDRVRNAIAEHSDPANPAEPEALYSIRRNSEQAALTWKTGLTAQEIARVRMRAEEVASAFYTAEDW